MSHSKIQITEPKHNIFESVWAAYLKRLQASPLKTKALTGAIVASTGDVIGQTIIKREAWDPFKTIRFTIYGAVVSTLIHYWYQFLDKMFKDKPKYYVLLRILVDQGVFAPFLNTLFFVVMGILEMKPETIAQRYSRGFVPQLLTYWKIWPLAQLINVRH